MTKRPDPGVSPIRVVAGQEAQTTVGTCVDGRLLLRDLSGLWVLHLSLVHLSSDFISYRRRGNKSNRQAQFVENKGEASDWATLERTHPVRSVKRNTERLQARIDGRQGEHSAEKESVKRESNTNIK